MLDILSYNNITMNFNFSVISMNPYISVTTKQFIIVQTLGKLNFCQKQVNP